MSNFWSLEISLNFKIGLFAIELYHQAHVHTWAKKGVGHSIIDDLRLWTWMNFETPLNLQPPQIQTLPIFFDSNII